MMKKVTNSFKKFAVIIVLLLMIASIVFSASALTNNAAFAAENSEGEEQTEVLSYKDIFEEYYNAVCSDLDKVSENYILTLDNFINGYYYNGFCYDEEVTIADYTSVIYAFVKENNKYEYEDNLISNYSASSKDANYFLSSLTDYTVTPASEFSRRPNYSGYEGKTFKLRECIKAGDIVHEKDAVAGIGHTGIVVDANHKSEYGTYVQTIESVNPYVKYAFLDDTRMVDFGVIVLRVQGINDVARQQVKYFCEQQLGKPYSLRPFSEANTSINSKEWFCSEMAYAAFRYAGLNISNSDNDVIPSNILPGGIVSSKNTYEKCLISEDYLDISLVGGGWTINIYNNTGVKRDIIYNQKMCFKSDAENWSNLKDEQIIYSVEDGDYATVTIKGNWFATSVAISYKRNNVRFITYADNLNVDKFRVYDLNKYYSVRYI